MSLSFLKFNKGIKAVLPAPLFVRLVGIVSILYRT
jgi:hypothetical protein